MFRNLFILSIILTLFSGCAQPVVSQAMVNDRIGNAGVYTQDYRLGISDKIRVKVYNEEALSGEFVVNDNGKISFPLVGEINAVGKTTQEIAASYDALLSDGYVVNPKTAVEIVSYRPYFILGEVKTPGQYPFSNQLTVLNAIAAAEGFTPRAQRKSVFIRRAGETEEKAYPLTPDLRVWPGDTIRLGERYF